MGLDHVRSEIVGRKRKEILQLQRAGISTASAELLRRAGSRVLPPCPILSWQLGTLVYDGGNSRWHFLGKG